MKVRGLFPEPRRLLSVSVSATKCSIDLRPSVIHACHSVETAIREIPRLLRGEFVAPESGLGTNAFRGNPPGSQVEKVPQAIIMGGGFQAAEFERIQQVCEPIRKMPWFRADTSRSTGPPPLELITQRIRESLEGNCRRAGDEVIGFEPGVFLF